MSLKLDGLHPTNRFEARLLEILASGAPVPVHVTSAPVELVPVAAPVDLEPLHTAIAELRQRVSERETLPAVLPEVRHEHTREVVRQELPQDVVDLIRAMARRQSDLDARVSGLETAVALMSSAKLDERVQDLQAIIRRLAVEADKQRVA